MNTPLLRVILILLTCVIGGGLLYTMYDIKSIIGIIASLIAILCAVFLILFNNFDDNLEQIIKKSDIALYKAKENGGNSHFIYVNE